MPRVNYVVGTYAFKEARYVPEGSQPDFKDYLRLNLQALVDSDLDSNDQITIMQPTVPWEPGFYDVDDIQLPCPVVKEPYTGHNSSYGQYLAAFGLYPQFDYYVFIEDDYYVANKRFKEDLIGLFNVYREISFDNDKNISLYLCTLAGNKPITRHARISNGITDRASLEKINLTYREVVLSDPEIPPQIAFSKLFDKIRDFSCEYLPTYWASMLNRVCLVGPNLDTLPEDSMFHPLQYLFNTSDLLLLD